MDYGVETSWRVRSSRPGASVKGIEPEKGDSVREQKSVGLGSLMEWKEESKRNPVLGQAAAQRMAP